MKTSTISKIIISAMAVGAVTLSFSASLPLTEFNKLCAQKPHGFAIALSVSAQQYAGKKPPTVTCSKNCTVKDKFLVGVVAPGETFAAILAGLGGFDAGGTASAELCENGALYKGEKYIEVSSNHGENKINKTVVAPNYRILASGEWSYTLKSAK